MASTPNPAKRNMSKTVNIVTVKEGIRTEHGNKGFVIDTYQCGASDCEHKFTAYRRSVIGAGRRGEKCGARNVVKGSKAASIEVKGRTAKPRTARPAKVAKPAKKAASKKSATKDPKAEAARLRKLKASKDNAASAKPARKPRAKAATPASDESAAETPGESPFQ